MSRSIVLVPAITRSAARSPVARIAGALSWLIGEFHLQRDLRAIESLDERALHDIGLGRAEVETAVRHGRASLPKGPRTIVQASPVQPLMPASWTDWR